uniref:Uncharacterized protein n=1 Tax=Podoviridae sp. ctXdu7 TaxID=2827618 RepID=A0A8S5RRM8_9CAUD|nr:MAG TPA: hypothetical protein [Podoviridae sp. ctXdu7]
MLCSDTHSRYSLRIWLVLFQYFSDFKLKEYEQQLLMPNSLAGTSKPMIKGRMSPFRRI